MKASFFADKKFLFSPYTIMAALYICFTVIAFMVDTPSGIWQGTLKILTSRSVLITDYIELGGLGATLLNSTVVGGFSLLLLIANKVKPNGATIMGLWLSAGFAFFGKNVFNMIPITFGVWLYAKVMKEPFKNFYLAAILSATLSPVVSELIFMDELNRSTGLFLGILLGVLVGFIFQPVSAALVKAHNGYMLYNMGFAGGLIATFVVCLIKGLGINIQSELYWSTGNNFQMAVLLYAIAVVLLVLGLISPDRENKKDDMEQIISHTGRMVTDYYILFGSSAYLNMGLLCALGTTVILFLGGDLNGPTIGAVFTMTGFGAFGKHIKNVIPILIGAIIATYINTWDPREPLNMLAILFSTCLAPIAGQYGWKWGVLTGILHVSIANFAGILNGGLNLYNNGFAGGFVAMVVVPLAMTFRKGGQEREFKL